MDFGIIVNGAVIHGGKHLSPPGRARRPDETVMQCILEATGEVQTEIVFTTLIIILAYLPLFTMQSVEKKMFAPMAYTIGFALIGSLIMALLIAPVLCFLLLRGKLRTRQRAVVRPALQERLSAVRCACALANPLPTLSAGGRAVRAFARDRAAPGNRVSAASGRGQSVDTRHDAHDDLLFGGGADRAPKVRAIMAKYQPVRLVVSQLGRPDDGTDATGFYNCRVSGRPAALQRVAGLHDQRRADRTR